VRLASPIGSAAGGSVNLSTSLSNVAKLAAHPKFVWVFNANCDGTIIYNDPVHILFFQELGDPSNLISNLGVNLILFFKKNSSVIIFLYLLVKTLVGFSE
jgi:hypothetical protein